MIMDYRNQYWLISVFLSSGIHSPKLTATIINHVASWSCELMHLVASVCLSVCSAALSPFCIPQSEDTDCEQQVRQCSSIFIHDIKVLNLLIGDLWNFIHTVWRFPDWIDKSVVYSSNESKWQINIGFPFLSTLGPICCILPEWHDTYLLHLASV